MTDFHVVIAVEDDLSEAVLRRLLQASGKPFIIHQVLGKQGGGWLKNHVPQFLAASRGIPHIVLTDLDNNVCASNLLHDWFGNRTEKNLLVRIAVREIESWLLADSDGFAKFARIPVNKVPVNPDRLDDPKQFLINLFRKSKSKRLAQEIIPEQGSTASIGPGYNYHLSEFVNSAWSLERAVIQSDSLRKAVHRIAGFPA